MLTKTNLCNQQPNLMTNYMTFFCYFLIMYRRGGNYIYVVPNYTWHYISNFFILHHSRFKSGACHTTRHDSTSVDAFSERQILKKNRRRCSLVRRGRSAAWGRTVRACVGAAEDRRRRPGSRSREDPVGEERS
jgi:hypothetical protein